GVGTFSILTRHIVPNVSSLLIVDATIGVCGAIIAETSLSYFGLGIQPPDVSLGTLLQDGTPAVVSRPWLFLFPAGFLIALLTSVSLIGDALRTRSIPPAAPRRPDPSLRRPTPGVWHVRLHRGRRHIQRR